MLLRLSTTSQFVKAEALYFQSVAIREKSLGKDDGLVAESLNNIATLYLEMGRRREAEPYLGGTFDAMRQMFKVTASWPIGDPGVNSRTEHYRVSRGLMINSVQ